jgi:pyrroloquinoline quinone (PQQ) biosynthesis protein C
MNVCFERSGALTEISSYPQWAQDVVGECEHGKQAVVSHELWDVIRDGTCGHECITNFMVGSWAAIERFPAYMAQSLLKTRYGRSAGDDLARRWLVRNIRVEQNHAEYWLHWAEGHGVSRESVLHGSAPIGTQTLARWCSEICDRGSLAAGIAASNYAVEGATGEWAQCLYESPQYTESFPVETRKATLRWLQLHAAYDDTHPWEALEIVCTLLGNSPSSAEVTHIAECVKRSYMSMCIVMDSCLKPSWAAETVYEPAESAVAA